MYGKLFKQEFDSSIITEAPMTRLLFHYLIMLADSDGVVDMIPHAIANRCNLPIDAVISGIECLMAPDPMSRTPAHEGRRLLQVGEKWGWQIVNYAKYRRIGNEEDRKKYKRDWMRRDREAKKKADVDTCGQPVDNGGQSGHREKEKEREKKKKRDDDAKASMSKSQGDPDLIRKVFDYWVKKTGRDPARTKLTDSRRTKIKARLQDSTKEEIRIAIDACAASDFHMGDNDRSRPYNDLAKHILKSREQVEQWNQEPEVTPDTKKKLKNGCIDCGGPKAEAWHNRCGPCAYKASTPTPSGNGSGRAKGAAPISSVLDGMRGGAA